MVFDPNIGKATQWKKGASGNPGGRPLSRLLSEALRTRLAEGPGAVHAASEIADRIEGRSRHSIEVGDFMAHLRARSDEAGIPPEEVGQWPS